ncbi:MAG: Mth938-like domain-containing protein [Candidatus Wenzhouxiangella sp. M2_3B_020]
MQLTEHTPDSRYFIRSLGPESIRIVDTDYSESLLLEPENGVSLWPVPDVDALSQDDLQPIIERDPEVVLLASGRTLRFPSQEIRIELLRRNIGVEVMTLDAAARTFNVLASEERRVLAALIWEPAPGQREGR